MPPSPHLAPPFVHVVRNSLDPAALRPPLRPGAHTLVNSVYSTLLKLITVHCHEGFLRFMSLSPPLPRQTQYSTRKNQVWSRLPQCPSPSLPCTASTLMVPCSPMGAHLMWTPRREAGLAQDCPTYPALHTANYRDSCWLPLSSFND